MNMNELIEILKNEDCSCVIENHGLIKTFHQRGVKDLFDLVTTDLSFLKGAMIADKVVGKGAAALMAVGGVSEVYAGVISTPALKMLESSGITATYDKVVPNIINRTGTGICPVESLCLNCVTPDECVPLIGNFLSGLSSRPGSD